MREVFARLERLGVAYSMTGSEALARYGQPRQTMDVDIVLDITRSEFTRVARAFDADFVVNEPLDMGTLNRETIDWPYLERWAAALGVSATLDAVRRAG